MAIQKTYDQIASDLIRPIRIGTGYKIWMAFLMVALGACVYAYILQLQEGLGVTGLRDYVSWGMYIANFVFFVACSLIGMFISSVLVLSGAEWARPLGRIAEIIALAFAAIAGLVIVSDMGRPDRLPYVFLHARVQSPIFWDVTVVTTYFVISLLLYFIPLIPDLPVTSEKAVKMPPIIRRIYRILALGWNGSAEQRKIIHRSTRILSILIIPVALAIHTVTSWLFAANPRPGWDSTIFGPYFVTGAFVAGIACVIIAMYVFRKAYRLEAYLTDKLFDRIGKVLVLMSLIYLYFNINEFLVPAYKMKQAEAIHIQELFTGHYAPLFWFAQLGGLIFPILLLLLKPMRKPLPSLVISLFVLAGSWIKRYLIVVPTQAHPYLPIQNVPDEFIWYKPTLIESAVTLGAVILVLIIISILTKFFPLIPIWETAEAAENSQKTEG